MQESILNTDLLKYVTDHFASLNGINNTREQLHARRATGCWCEYA